MSYLPCAICAYFGSNVTRGVVPAATAIFNLGVVRDELGLSRDEHLRIEHVVAVALCKEDGDRIAASLHKRGRPDPKHGYSLDIDSTVRDVVGGKPFGPKDVNPAVRDAVTRLLMHRTRFITLPDFMVTEAEDILGISAKPAAEQGQKKQEPQPQPKSEEAKAAKPQKPAPAQPKQGQKGGDKPKLKGRSEAEPAQIQKPIPCRLSKVVNTDKGVRREDMEATCTVEPGQLCELLGIAPESLTVEQLLAVAFNDIWTSTLDKQGIKYIGLEKALGMMAKSARVSLVQASRMEVDKELTWAVQVIVFGENLGVMATDAADLPEANRIVRAMGAPTTVAYEDEASSVTLGDLVKAVGASK